MFSFNERFTALRFLQPAAAITFTVVANAGEFQGKPYKGGDVRSDTGVATDSLGRVVPGFTECGPVRKDKWVGIFYWTWHTPHSGPYDNTKILAEAGYAVSAPSRTRQP